MWCGCLEPFAESVARWLGGSSTSIERRQVLTGMVATLSLAGAGCASTTPAQKIAGTALLDETISVDLHSHPGLVRRLARATMDGHIERLAAGRVRASLIAAVGDGPVLTISPQGRIYARREPQPEELYRATYTQLEQVQTRITAGKLMLVEQTADLERARSQGRHAAVLAVEGGDFRFSNVGRARMRRLPTRR